MDNDNDIKLTGGLAPAILKTAWFWAVLRWCALIVMIGMITAAWGRRGIEDIGTPDPLMYTNLGNLAFWVLWLMGIVVLVPLVGRAWCGVCPIGAVNEFAARFGLKKVFPKMVRNQYSKAAILLLTVLLMGLYQIHHYPDATAWYLLAWLMAAVLMGLLFAGRSLCAYVCPVGGMLGLYGRVAPVRCGVRDEGVCRNCEDRECIRGAVSWFTTGFGRLKMSFRLRKNPCPVNLRVWEMDGSDRCLMCMNCLRVCPLDNVALFARKPLSSLWTEKHPRFSDTVFLAGLMGFVLLTFSRFWPPAQEIMIFPVRWLGPALGVDGRPVHLAWIGFGLPFIAFLVFGAVAGWNRSGSVSDIKDSGPLSRAVLPLKIWFEDREPPGDSDPSGEEKIMASDSVRGLSSTYAPAVIPFVLSSHLVLALVKLNTKIAYLPLAAADPVGVRSYMAIWEFDLLPRPGAWLSVSALGMVSVAVLAAGTILSLWAYLRISKREGSGALPMLLPLVLFAVVVYGGLYNWLF